MPWWPRTLPCTTAMIPSNQKLGPWLVCNTSLTFRKDSGSQLVSFQQRSNPATDCLDLLRESTSNVSFSPFSFPTQKYTVWFSTCWISTGWTMLQRHGWYQMYWRVNCQSLHTDQSCAVAHWDPADRRILRHWSRKTVMHFEQFLLRSIFRCLFCYS